MNDSPVLFKYDASKSFLSILNEYKSRLYTEFSIHANSVTRLPISANAATITRRHILCYIFHNQYVCMLPRSICQISNRQSATISVPILANTTTASCLWYKTHHPICAYLYHNQLYATQKANYHHQACTVVLCNSWLLLYLCIVSAIKAGICKYIWYISVECNSSPLPQRHWLADIN